MLSVKETLNYEPYYFNYKYIKVLLNSNIFISIFIYTIVLKITYVCYFASLIKWVFSGNTWIYNVLNLLVLCFLKEWCNYTFPPSVQESMYQHGKWKIIYFSKLSFCFYPSSVWREEYKKESVEKVTYKVLLIMGRISHFSSISTIPKYYFSTFSNSVFFDQYAKKQETGFVWFFKPEVSHICLSHNAWSVKKNRALSLN